MEVRPMNPADLEEVARLEQEVSGWSLESVASELYSRRGGVQLVAVMNTKIIGWCCGAILVDEGELLKITVDKDHRRSGVGSALLTHLQRQFLAQGCKSVFLEVRSQNDAAVNFYLNFGYFQVGLRKKYYRYPDDDALIFRKDIRQ